MGKRGERRKKQSSRGDRERESGRESDRSRQSGRAARKREGVCESVWGGGEQTRSARDSICSHGLVLRRYKYLM